MEPDINTFLKQGIHYKLADFCYRHFIGPVVDVLERLVRWNTKRWVEARIPKSERIPD